MLLRKMKEYSGLRRAARGPVVRRKENSPFFLVGPACPVCFGAKKRGGGGLFPAFILTRGVWRNTTLWPSGVLIHDDMGMTKRHVALRGSECFGQRSM
jgi:hypothetical protein